MGDDVEREGKERKARPVAPGLVEGYMDMDSEFTQKKPETLGREMNGVRNLVSLKQKSAIIQG